MSVAQQGIAPSTPSAPPERRIYAIGDIHGRYDLLDRLLELIQADAEDTPTGHEKILIFLGDYVDRGPQSKRVIERLSMPPPAGFDIICLKGNHEEMLLEFLEGKGALAMWLGNGGRETLESYGLNTKNLSLSLMTNADVEKARLDLRKIIPGSHIEFLTTLDLIHEEGDYAFVHAGIRPGVSLCDQKEQDLIWIKDKFLKSEANFDKIIVHGHSVESQPTLKANRIGIDTGAWRTGVLTCLVLEGTQRRFLST